MVTATVSFPGDWPPSPVVTRALKNLPWWVSRWCAPTTAWQTGPGSAASGSPACCGRSLTVASYLYRLALVVPDHGGALALSGRSGPGAWAPWERPGHRRKRSRSCWTWNCAMWASHGRDLPVHWTAAPEADKLYRITILVWRVCRSATPGFWARVSGPRGGSGAASCARG